MKFQLPDLPYKYNAIEPFIDEETMKIHHTKHHQTYINNANDALANLPAFNNLSIEELIKKIHLLPENKQNILRNNAGGHFNHELFWRFMKQGTVLHGTLKKYIEKDFGNIENFQMIFEKVAINRFGSGWVWLIKKHNNLAIISTANQDNPLMGENIVDTCGYPIIGIDVWEHAYYLKYQNRRLEYIKALWNVLNWDEAELRINQTL